MRPGNVRAVLKRWNERDCVRELSDLRVGFAGILGRSNRSLAGFLALKEITFVTKDNTSIQVMSDEALRLRQRNAWGLVQRKVKRQT